MTTQRLHFIGLVSICLALWATAYAPAQPSLLPPGPPTAPSGRVGVRTEIRTMPYVITTPGSYYLANNLLQTVAGTSGITVFSNDVTIDLNGFSLIGLATPGDLGITFGPGAVRNITIYNGFVESWGGGGINLPGIQNVHLWEITCSNNGPIGVNVGPNSIVRHVITSNNMGFGLFTAYGCKVTNITAFFNAGDGISVGPNSHISDSTATSNSANGFVVGPNSVAVASVAENNGGDGFFMVMNGRATDCAANNNGFGGGFGSGFFMGGPGNNLGGCTAMNNFNSGFESLIMGPPGGTSAQNCSASSNGFASGIGDGFTNLRTITDCTANGNFDNGIELWQGGHAFRNTCEGNGANGIEANSDGNVIEENHVYSNTAIGISTLPNIGPMGNMVARNRAHANGGAYAFIAAFDTTGAIIVGPAVLGAVAAHMANVAY